MQNFLWAPMPLAGFNASVAKGKEAEKELEKGMQERGNEGKEGRECTPRHTRNKFLVTALAMSSSSSPIRLLRLAHLSVNSACCLLKVVYTKSLIRCVMLDGTAREKSNSLQW